jgi:hypothetical protein
MSDTIKDPQATDPPTNTGGGGTAADVEEQPQPDFVTDPPTNTGGGGSA